MRRVWIVGVGLLLASGCATSSVVANAPNPSRAAVSGMVASSASPAVSERPNTSSAAVGGMVGSSASSAVSEPPPPTLATVSGTTAAPPGTPTACTSPQLAITLGESQQVMDQPAIAVIFTNTSDAPCTLYGYPGVAGLDTRGHQITQAYRTSQVYEGGAPTGPTRVTLASGGQASALIGGSANPVNGQTACPADYAAVLVTPPGATGSTALPIDFPSCPGLAVTPVVPGPTGGFLDLQSSP
jgi:hypothetical protein